MIYGTAWKRDQTAVLVVQALEAGFRRIDSANQPRHYNEDGAGAGIRTAIESGLVSREQLHVKIEPLGST